MRPGLAWQIGVGLGEDLAPHRHFVGNLKAEERALLFEGRELLRALPGESAAEDAPAAAQPHRHEIVGISRCEPRAGEAQQDAAILDELLQPLVIARGKVADVGQNQHIHMLVEQRRDRIGRSRPRLANIGEGRQAL